MDPSLFSIFDLIIILYGAFMLSWWFRVKFRGETFPPNLLLPQDLLLDECRDIPGYNRFIVPRVLIFALILLLMGGSSFVLRADMPEVVFFAIYAGFFLLVALLYVDTGKKARTYW